MIYYFFFFFKQKTAYEIGLGIPAEPLFRSLKVKNVLALAMVVRSRCEVLKASVKALVFGMYVVNNFNCRGFGPLLEDKLCLIFKLAPSVCRMTFPILASLLVRLVVLLPRSEERFSRNAETDLVCRLLLEKKNREARGRERGPYRA